jgi:hypothetical protein
MNTPMKKAIVTFGVGYGYHQIKNFVFSCARHVPDADVYIYAGNNFLELQSRFVDYPRVKFLHYSENLVAKLIGKAAMKFPPLAKFYGSVISFMYRLHVLPAGAARILAAPLVQFMVKRFFALHQLVNRLPHDQWMFTDLRDVLFLEDPFANLDETSIVTGVEPVRIHECNLNRKWLSTTYSRKLYKMVRNEYVACAGVTLGSRKVILQYLNEVSHDTLLSLPNIIGMLGADQAIHIKLLYKGLKGVKKQLEVNGRGSIATLHYSTLHEFDRSMGRLANRSGKTLAVIHQYDRHPRLAQDLLADLQTEVPEFLAKAS